MQNKCSSYCMSCRHHQSEGRPASRAVNFHNAGDSFPMHPPSRRVVTCGMEFHTRALRDHGFVRRGGTLIHTIAPPTASSTAAMSACLSSGVEMEGASPPGFRKTPPSAIETGSPQRPNHSGAMNDPEGTSGARHACVWQRLPSSTDWPAIEHQTRLPALHRRIILCRLHLQLRGTEPGVNGHHLNLRVSRGKPLME